MRHLITGAALMVAAISCGSPTPGPWQPGDGYRWRELRVRGGDAGFSRMDAFEFTNTVSESLLLGNRVLGQGAGVAMGDVDGDGLVDVFLARTEGCDALYRNRGGWRFEDMTKSSGLGACDRHSSAASLVDIDGDRDLDLVLLAITGPNAVFMNDGRGRFTERRDLGLDTTGRGGSALAFADIDGDDALEMFVANYKAWNIDDSIPPQRRAFNQMVRQVAPGRFEIVPEHRAHYKLVMRPDMGGLRMTTRAEPNQLYGIRNGRFQDIGGTGRFRDTTGAPVRELPESFSMAARFADLNGDGAPDLYVTNDFEDPDELWINDGSGNFAQGSWTALRQLSNSSMGMDVGDLNADGRADIFVSDMLSNDTRRLKTQIPTHTALPKRPGESELQLQQQRNTLHINRGDGSFVELGHLAGVSASGWSWGTLLTDVDLDGWQDILVANGHLWDIMDADTHERLQSRLVNVHWQRLRWEFPRLELRNVAFRNRGNLTFEDVSDAWDFGVEEDISHALAAGDLDADGDVDIVVNRLGAPALVLRNDAGAARVAVRLVGDTPNTHAIGARVRLVAPGMPDQVREVVGGGLYLSHSDYQLSFATTADSAARLEIDWPDGRRSVISDVRANRLYEVTTASAGDNGRPTVRLTSADPDASLFVDATSLLGGHRHVDPPFDDWARQFLLVNSLSQLGPGVAWHDIDRDGDDDIIVGNGRTGALSLMRNERGRFAAMTSPLTGAPGDITGIVALSHEAGANAASSVIVGTSSWEARTPGAATSVTLSRAGLSVRPAEPLAGSPDVATGPTALGDYDGDGDLDLFVGGRAVTAQYPRAASSLLYRNESGRFIVDSVASRPLASAGLVSAAVFADMDGDGDDDLLLAREWQPIQLLINDRGAFRSAGGAMARELERWPSRWNGIATGDLDGDGRLDIVATSWGRNTVFQPDTARPIVMVHGPFGPSGTEEMVIAQHDPRIGALAPLNSYPRVRVAVPDLTDRVRRFVEYADASIEQVLGPATARVTRRPITTLDHMVFLNRGDHFESAPLPLEAQFAPAFGVTVADYDGDGAEDVFLAQNFSFTALGLPRYDAGRGLLLKGNGRGELAALDARASGIVIHGDQRGAAHADFDGDGRLDLLVAQNAEETRLFRNRGARTGLRVRLQGAPGNPDGIGALIRVVYANGLGPVRQVQAGSGYWSQNSAVQVLGLSATPVGVSVRWPGGRETRVNVPSGAAEITIPFASP